MARSHLYKRAEAIGHAHGACGYLRMAIDAARGVHQANERVRAWMEKVDAEVKS